MSVVKITPLSGQLEFIEDPNNVNALKTLLDQQSDGLYIFNKDGNIIAKINASDNLIVTGSLVLSDSDGAGGLDNTNDVILTNTASGLLVNGQDVVLKNIDASALLGGTNNDLNGTTNTVILGGSNITALANSTAYVPSLNIQTITTASGTWEVLVRDTTSLRVEKIANNYFQQANTFLGQIAGLTPTNDDILQYKSSAWTNRTLLQYKTDLLLNNVDNTSDVNKPISTATQTALNGKQAIITGAATTITLTDLTNNRAVISNASGKIAVSTTTDTELSYVSGVTSAIQTQLNGKEPTLTKGNFTGADFSITGGTGAVIGSGLALALATQGGLTPGDWTKVTVNSKGIITAAVLATTADIADSLDKRYVLDADLTNLSNLSGTNTGDETNSTILSKLGYTPLNKAGDTMTGTLVLNADPTLALHAATKQYVDLIASGLKPHAAVDTITTVNLVADYDNGTLGVGATLTANPSVAIPLIGGYTPVNGDRILVKNQSNGFENGIYEVTQATAPWILTRATDFDQSSEIQAGDLFYVSSGTFANTGWVHLTEGTIIVGTTALSFTQFSSLGVTYTEGTGIDILSNVISIDNTVVTLTGAQALSNKTGNISQWTNNSNYITLTSLSGVSPISYNNLTGAISILQSSSVQNGYLSSTDWTSFNSREYTNASVITTSGALTNYSNTIRRYIYTGTTFGDTFKFGDATGYSNGLLVYIINNSTQVIDCLNNSNVSIVRVFPKTTVTLYLQSNATANGTWTFEENHLNKTLYQILWDDFNSPTTAGETNWTVTTAGGGGVAITVQATASSNNVGVIRLNSGTAAAGRASLHKGNISYLIGAGFHYFETYVNIATLSTATDEYSLRIGWGDQTGAGDMVDGVYFEYDRLNSVNWRIKTSNNSTRTATSTGTAVATGWVKLAIEISGNGTRVDYFINGTNVGNITTNIPTGANRNTDLLLKIERSAATATRTLDIDYIRTKTLLNR
jgi:hypothetical protein